MTKTTRKHPIAKIVAAMITAIYSAGRLGKIFFAPRESVGPTIDYQQIPKRVVRVESDREIYSTVHCVRRVVVRLYMTEKVSGWHKRVTIREADDSVSSVLAEFDTWDAASEYAIDAARRRGLPCFSRGLFGHEEPLTG